MMPLVVCATVLIEKSPQAIPLGAACIASAIKNDARTAGKCSVVLTSVTAEDAEFSAAEKDGRCGVYIAEKILSFGKPAVACLSVYVWNRKILLLAALELKKKYPEIICIAGGPEITANPFGCKEFDYTVAGEGEGAVPELVSEILAGNKPENIKGIYSPKNADLDDRKNIFPHVQSCNPYQLSSPWLDGTINPSDYGGALWELARGCPFKCSYCYESKGEKKVRYFPRERLEQELDFFAVKKVPQVFILDPTYNADKKRALEMLRLIKRKTPEMFCYFEARAEFIDRELARAFTEIPCALQIGLQSAHEDVLAKVNRTLDKKLFIRNVGYLNDAGAVFGFDLIYGLPGDSLSGFRESIDFAMTLYPNNLELFCLSVLPGTDLYDNAEKLMLTWQKEPPYHVIHTDKYTEDDIKKAEQIALSCSLFYNQGRAVPWFNAVLKSLHIKPSTFFTEFAQYMNSELKRTADLCLPHKDIEQIQLDFIRKKYTEKNIAAFIPAAEDIIKLNGAISRTQVDGTKETVRLHYDSDDVMSEYASDITYFVKNIKAHACSAQTFMTKDGADWKKI